MKRDSEHQIIVWKRREETAHDHASLCFKHRTLFDTIILHHPSNGVLVHQTTHNQYSYTRQHTTNIPNLPNILSLSPLSPNEFIPQKLLAHRAIGLIITADEKEVRPLIQE